MTINMFDQGVLSPRGKCRTFDADADGYARGEAISALYLKPLSKALRDGDNVRGVIRGSAVNHDGKTPGITSPSTAAQEALIRHTYKLAGIEDVNQTAFVECHGTGTPVGDPLETNAVANVFGRDGVFIGSVKANLGHSEGASGLSSVIKMCLAMEHKQIPPQVNFEKPNPKIPFERCKLKVPVSVEAWPADRAERCSVNSFGVGGSNAHVILESAESWGVAPTKKALTDAAFRTKRLLLTSGTSNGAVKEYGPRIQSYLEKNAGSLHDVAHTLSSRREDFRIRAFSVVDGDNKVEFSQPIRTGSDNAPKAIWVFTGQGAQYAGMGKELFEEEPLFRDTIRELDACLKGLGADAPEWTLEGEILKTEGNRLGEAELSQPCCTAIQVGLVTVLRSWGMQPDAVVGHSSGEIGAAFAAGSLSATDAIKSAYHRGQIFRGLGSNPNHPKGKMAAVGLGRKDVEKFLIPGVIIGCENSPASVTLSGDAEKIDQVLATIKTEQPDTFSRALAVECAYHSHHMKLVEAKYRARLEKAMTGIPAKVPFFSSVFNKQLDETTPLDASYWVANLGNPVLFSTALDQAVKSFGTEKKVLLEVGPHTALKGPIRQVTQGDNSVAYVGSLVRGNNAMTELMKTAGEAWANNIHPDFSKINPAGNLLMDLPRYGWQREGQFWTENRIARNWRLRKFPHHDLLGSRLPGDIESFPIWRNALMTVDSIPWVSDHVVFNDIVFPAAGYIAMAGEAIFQLTGSRDYTIRSMDVKKALIMHPGETKETITGFEPVHLTNQLDSVWYNFHVSTFDGTAWVKHVSGQARGGPPHGPDAVDTEEGNVPGGLTSGQRIKANLGRSLKKDVFYKHMARLGLKYGPKFQNLEKISTDVDEQKAVALITDSRGQNESRYALHPSTIDQLFQLLGAAGSKGVLRHFKKVSIPTFLEELYVRPAAGDIQLEARAAPTPRGAMKGDCVGVSAGKPVIQLKQMQMTPLADGDVPDDAHGAAELEWKPHVDFLNLKEMMHPSKDYSAENMLLDRLMALLILNQNPETLVPGAEQATAASYKKFLEAKRAEIVSGKLESVPDGEKLASLSEEERSAAIADAVAKLSAGDAAPIAAGLQKLSAALPEIFEGKTEAQKVLDEEGFLSSVYQYYTAGVWNYENLFSLIGHLRPGLRILEIGAGAGETTSSILPLLKSAQGARMYLTYTYTDSNEAYFDAAKERLGAFDGLKFETLDITKDLEEQGFEPASYDLIIASNTIHNTANIKEALTNVRKLMTPKGRLFLQELTPKASWISYVLGNLSSFWLGGADGRADSPFAPASRWDEELKATGFGGAEVAIFDGALNTNIFARAAARKAEKPLTVLHDDANSTRLLQVVDALKSKGYEVQLQTLKDTPAPKQDIVAVFDLEKPWVEALTEENFEDLKKYVGALKDSGLLWVTGSGQIRSTNPNYAMVLGLARVVSAEAMMDFATLELENFDAAALKSVGDVAHEFVCREEEADLQPIREYAYAQECIQVGRFQPLVVEQELIAGPEDVDHPKKLDIGQAGVLQTLGWKQCTLPDLVGDAVEIDVRAVGLNFKDVLISMGIVEGSKAEAAGLGSEGSGVVTAVGPDVKELKVGDRVGFISGGSFRTKLRQIERLVTKLPDNLTFENASTIPLVFVTVMHGLLDRARMTKGQSVLIQSACGGVGLAAIQICQMIGAEIYCTVGNPEKVEYLMKNHGIPRDHIFNSRDTSFLRDVKAVTGGKGVDIVLNSLSGELLHASWQCVKPYGYMIEIGKRDFLGKGFLALSHFEYNRTFVGLDLSFVFEDQPEIAKRLLDWCMVLHGEGKIKSIAVAKTFEGEKTQDAFRFMQKGTHIGKIIVTMPEDSKVLGAVGQRGDAAFKSDKTYFLVGGLGGLGRPIATWMVENGARQFIFFSRSAGKSAEDRAFVRELELQGCSAQAIQGSIVNPEDVEKAVAAAKSPIAGIFQASMVLKDTPFEKMSFEDWKAAVDVKVAGTWNLHNALAAQEKTQPLDFFLMMSSIAGLLGNPGQANYAAGNTFQDAFTQYRHGLGLASSTLDIGAMEDIGYVATNDRVMQILRSTFPVMLHEQELLDSLQLLMKRGTAAAHQGKSSAAHYICPSHVAIGVRSSESGSSKKMPFNKDQRLMVFKNMEIVKAGGEGSGGADAGNEELKKFLKDCAVNTPMLDDPANHEFLGYQIGKTLFGFMLRGDEEVDLGVPLADLGVDSLVGIELRNWFRHGLGVDVTVLDIMNVGNLLGLGKFTAGKLKEKHGGA